MYGGPCDGVTIEVASPPPSPLIVPVTVHPPENMRGPGDELGRPFQARATYLCGVTSGERVYLFSSIHS